MADTEAHSNWLSTLGHLRDSKTACVLITVITSKGSTPREAGTKMVVTTQDQFGTIGGGNLEFQAIEQARNLLEDFNNSPKIKDYALGPSLAQCCGGAVSILLEPFLNQLKTIAIFGAGHVGKEIVQVLNNLPINIKWIDQRAQEFPDNSQDNVEKITTATPTAELKDLPDGGYILIVTHDHDLDYDLTETALKQNKFAYLGLIGSDTKKAKFKKRLAVSGISDTRINDMTCPIGIEGIKGKHPREIAVAVAAELLKSGLTHGKE